VTDAIYEPTAPQDAADDPLMTNLRLD